MPASIPRLVILCLTAALACCAAPPRGEAGDARANRDLNHGYGLLYLLVTKQAKLDTLLLFKSESAAVGALVKQIAAASDEAGEALERMAKADALLDLADTGLPATELAARASIEAQTGKALLGAGGAALDFRLLSTQVEATRYGVALARAVAAAETDDARAAWLEAFATRYQALHTQALAAIMPDAPKPGDP
jgi:hypothetical protein